MSPLSPPGGVRDANLAGPLDRPTAVALLTRADALVEGGDYAPARPLYQRLVGSRDPDLHVAALLGLAETSYRLDDEDAAVEAWRLATQAPENALSWLAWKRLAAARVRHGDLGGAKAAYREAERRAPAEERAEIAARLGWLSKETGDARAAAHHFGRARTGSASALVTYAIIAVTVGIGVSAFLGSAEIWFLLFGLDKAAVAEGELWRLLTVVLVHDPVLPLHLASNMYALYLVGPIVEGLYGRALFLAFYLLSAAAGSVASYVFLPNDAAGASGAIFGLFGLLAVAHRVHRPLLGRRAGALTSQIGILIAFNLVLGFGLAGTGFRIDNAAHVGGLIAGAWLGLLFVPTGAALLSRAFQRSGDGRSAAAGTGTVMVRGLGVGLLVVVIGAGLWVGNERRNGGPRDRDPESSRGAVPAAAVGGVSLGDAVAGVATWAQELAAGRDAGRSGR